MHNTILHKAKKFLKVKIVILEKIKWKSASCPFKNTFTILPLDDPNYEYVYINSEHGKHEVVGSNPTRANILYGIEKP